MTSWNATSIAWRSRRGGLVATLRVTPFDVSYLYFASSVSGIWSFHLPKLGDS
jgi:hypothetical protein